MSPEESRLIAAERRTFWIDEALRDLRRQLAAVRQGIQDEEQAFEDASARYVDVLVGGAVHGCSGRVARGGSIAVTRVSDSIVLGTYPVDSSGAWSGPVGLSGDTPVTIAYTPAADFAARFNAGSASATLKVVPNNSTPTINLTAASGYTCNALVWYPLVNTLDFTDSVWGSGTMTLGAGWVGCFQVAYAAYLTCLAATNLPIQYTLSTAGVLTANYPRTSPTNQCPGTGGLYTCDPTAPNWPGGDNTPVAYTFVLTQEYPFIGTWTMSGSNAAILYRGDFSATVTVTEP